MTNHSSRFQRQGFIILMICSAIMLGIGIYMFVADFNSTSIVTSWRFNPSEQTISWQTPVFKNTGMIPTFPKEYECTIRYRIDGLLLVKEDKWYCITSGTDVLKLWCEIERDLTEYILPFFIRYNTASDVILNQFIYRKGGMR